MAISFQSLRGGSMSFATVGLGLPGTCKLRTVIQRFFSDGNLDLNAFRCNLGYNLPSLAGRALTPKVLTARHGGR